jgi:GR25 family glycosyltransferase involved in LPS biosynthesis
MIEEPPLLPEIVNRVILPIPVPLKKIEHVLYINLNQRKDRKKHVEEQLASIGLGDCAERFPAICLKDGRVGCTMSHLKCLQTAKERNWSHVFICEDDILFLNPNLLKDNIAKFLSNEVKWDVLLIGGNNVPPYKRVALEYIKVGKCQTTTGYIVQAHYYDKLIQNIREGMQLLMKNPENHFHYAIDKYWFDLQEKDSWFLITPLTVTQKDDYSDIEKRRTNYERLMLDLDKPWLASPQNVFQLMKNYKQTI